MAITIEYLWKDRKRYFGMPISFTRYSLSEDRLFLSVGFLSIRDDEILLYRVRDIDTSRCAECAGLCAVRSMGNRDRLFEDFFRLTATQCRCKSETVFRPVDGQAAGFACAGIDGVTRSR